MAVTILSSYDQPVRQGASEMCKANPAVVSLASRAALAALALCGLASPSRADSPCAAHTTSTAEILNLGANEPLTIEIGANEDGILIEEQGSDVLYQTRGQTGFAEIAIKPPRLGILALRAGSGSLVLKLSPGQAPATVKLHRGCISEATLSFFERLHGLYRDQIDAGADKAAQAGAPLKAALATNTDPNQRALLALALANALSSAGQHQASMQAYLDAHKLFAAADDPTRAAVALLAAGEDASRSSDYDRATALFDEAQIGLAKAGLNYYALRAEAAYCLIQSRRGEVLASVICEEKLPQRFEQLGERSEAGARGISIANQWLKLGELGKAKQWLDHVDSAADALNPIVAARLRVGFGNYHLERGELDAAAHDYAHASALLNGLGFPRDQANIDIKLSRVAKISGAHAEEARLLERALAQISPTDGPERVASIAIRLANLQIALGAPAAARNLLKQAQDLCLQVQAQDCAERVALANIRADLELADVVAARLRLDNLQNAVLSSSALQRTLLEARILLAENQPRLTLQRLSKLRDVTRDPDLLIEVALVRANAQIALGDQASARDGLLQTLTNSAVQTASWPAPALRATAGHRLARLQAELIDLWPSPTRGTVEPRDAEALRLLIHAGDSTQWPTQSSDWLSLPEGIRDALSRAIASDEEADQRALFLALATRNGDAPGRTETPPKGNVLAAAARAAQSGTWLVPIAGKKRFLLFAASGSSYSLCHEQSAAEYAAAATRFERALWSLDNNLEANELEAQRWFDIVQACLPNADEWRVVATPGTRLLPWSWIAASAERRGQREPRTLIAFDIGPLAELSERPATGVVANLNLDGSAALPFAKREQSRVLGIFDAHSVPARALSFAEIQPEHLLASISAERAWVHVIGHGNPPTYGSLYAGLWIPATKGPALITYPEIASSKVQSELVVLSACGDAVGDKAAAGSGLRTVQALLTAGTDYVVAAANPTNDSAAAYWSSELFEQLLGAGNAAAAMQSVRSSLRRSPHFRHPKFWAGLDVYAGSRRTTMTKAVVNQPTERL